MNKFICLAILFVLPLQSFSLSISRPEIVGTYFRASDQSIGDPYYREKLSVMLLMIQEFYRKGMQLNGYGSQKTFFLSMDKSGKPTIILFRGQKPYSFYARPDGSGWGSMGDEMCSDSNGFGSLWPLMKAATVFEGAGAGLRTILAEDLYEQTRQVIRSGKAEGLLYHIKKDPQ